MKTHLPFTLLLASICIAAPAREITLTVNNESSHGATNASDAVSIGTNEVAEVRSTYGNGAGATLYVIKNGITNLVGVTSSSPVGVRVAGPATLRLAIESPGGPGINYWFCSVKIEPESFPPGQTIILPEGTVGVIHVESSTNLITWQDQWSQSFSNTNQNRFFRLRAERSLP